MPRLPASLSTKSRHGLRELVSVRLQGSDFAGLSQPPNLSLPKDTAIQLQDNGKCNRSRGSSSSARSRGPGQSSMAVIPASPHPSSVQDQGDLCEPRFDDQRSGDRNAKASEFGRGASKVHRWLSTLPDDSGDYLWLWQDILSISTVETPLCNFPSRGLGHFPSFLRTRARASILSRASQDMPFRPREPDRSSAIQQSCTDPGDNNPRIPSLGNASVLGSRSGYDEWRSALAELQAESS